MPNPTASDVHVNQPLTNISVAWAQSQNVFIADRVFPNITVAKQSDRYFEYDRGDFYRNEMAKRAPGTESAGAGWRIDNTPSYFCDVFALHKDIDDQVRANSDTPINMDRDAARYLMQQAMQKRDKTWATDFFAAGVWTNDQTGVASGPSTDQFLQWDNAASTPIEDIRAMIFDMEEQTGYRPNKLVLGPNVWKVLADHGDLLDRIKYTQRAVVGPDLLAAALELDEVLIPRGIHNTAAEEATDSFAYIHGKSALLVYTPSTPSLLTPSAGYTFSWNGLLGMTALGSRMKTFRMEHLNSDRVEVEMAYDQKLVSADLGRFFASCVA